MPERFNLEYVGSDGQKHRPVIIHRAPFGSLERFIGVLIEHFAGHFPLWLAPEQVRVLTISEKSTEQNIVPRLFDSGHSLVRVIGETNDLCRQRLIRIAAFLILAPM